MILKYVLLAACFSIFFSCKKNPVDTITTLRGAEINMANGKANSFLKIDGNGNPLEIGFELTAEALVGLTMNPNDFPNRIFVLPLEQNGLALTPFDHLVINWQPVGHPPSGTFDLPHFDFHFYTITPAERLAIPAYSSSTAAKIDLLPPAGFMPATYKADPGGIPAMGKHWIDQSALTSPFTHTMIYGSFDGQVNFIEPVVTLAVLQAGTTFNIPYAQPQNFAKTGKWYPTKYNIYKDNSSNNHYVTLTDFVKR